jgi:glycosyltransferase involved in cell wall biosynthesis
VITLLRGAPPKRRREAVASGGPVPVAVVIAQLTGGAGLLALRGALAMDPGRFAVTIVTGSGNGLIDEAAQGGLEVIVEPSLCRSVSPGDDVRAMRRLVALFEARRFGVVHTHCAKAGVLGRLGAHHVGVPRIVHSYHGFHFHEFQSPARRHAYISIERRLGALTDMVLCVGTAVAAEAVRRRLIAPQRIRTMGVIVDGPETEAASGRAWSPGARRLARAALGIPVDATVVGTVGRLTFQKAPEDFLAAMVALRRPQVIGVWVGGGELADDIGRRARELAGAQVVLAGERTDVLEILPAFDVFAMTSRYEGLPTAVVEAMICGVPVVATAVNSVSDLVIPGETGLLVPPERPDLVADAIGYLLDTLATAARMAATALGSVKDRFGAPTMATLLEGAYMPAGQGCLVPTGTTRTPLAVS